MFSDNNNGPPRRSDSRDGGGGRSLFRPNSNNDQQRERRYQRYNSGPRYNNNNDRGKSDSRRRQDRSHLPLERGSIRSLLDKFGFIYCADRPEEVFFHYSEVEGIHPDDLKVDDEVEFRIGPSTRTEEDKNAAYSVKFLERGTVVWEDEEEPGRKFKGFIDKLPRGNESNTSVEGSISFLQEETDELERPKGTGDAIPFDLGYEILNDQNKHVRLGRLDVVEFRVVTARRTGQKQPRDIRLVRSERDRQHQAKEKQLLANAVVEQGVVSTLKKEFGFLRSCKRREEVYFHYSNVMLKEGDNDEESILREGQEMEFLVVSDQDRLSARQVTFLPAGSVQFDVVVAVGVKGVITRCPHLAIDSRRRDEKPVDDIVGVVKLLEPIVDKDTGSTVTEVRFHSADAPGGSFAVNREGSQVGLWVRDGDTLLFDVLKELVDSSYHLAPTSCLSAGSPTGDNPSNGPQKDSKAVRLIGTCLAGRTEGIISSIKDNFGFIHCAERNVDVYFRHYEVLPLDIQMELRRNMGIDAAEQNIKLTVGTEVQFDMSLQGTIGTKTNRRNSGGARASNSERENLKAQRLCLLPPSTIVQSKVLGTDVKGVISKVDPKNVFCGVIELEDTVQSMSQHDRHPLLIKLIESLLDEQSVVNSVVFPDLQSMKEDQLVMNIAESLGGGKLRCSHLPVSKSEFQGHPGRLSISRIDKVDDADEQKDTTTEQGRSSSPHPKKKHSTKQKNVKTVGYDKRSLVETLKEDYPPGKSDKIICNVSQNRRTGAVSVTNLKIVERVQEVGATTSLVTDQNATCGVGIVVEVLQNRQYGFISVHDEVGTRHEVLYFHISSVKPSVTDENKGGQKHGKAEIKKGDEVKFDIVIGKNGKRAAEKVTVLPRGTIKLPVKAEKNACQGYILMEPSFTTLSNTPLHLSSKKPQNAASAGGRWDLVNSDNTQKQAGSSVKEEGVILLLSAPTNSFGQKNDTETNGKTDANPKEAKEADSNGGTSQLGNKGAKISADTLPRSLRYKNVDVATRGTGSISSVDGRNGPRRGDLVSFVKAKSAHGVRDIRVMKQGAAILVRGTLTQIAIDSGKACFHVKEKEDKYDIDLSEVISCSISILKENEPVEGVLHSGKMYGICRTSDLYLESKLGMGGQRKERPRLNLTVRKNRGGQIVAQSGMAKGPDGSNGFAPGWTTRQSKFSNRENQANSIDEPEPGADSGEIDIEPKV